MYGFLSLIMAALLLALPSAGAGELSGTIVGHDGNPVPWIKQRVFNETKKRYQSRSIPSVQIDLTVRTGETIGLANAESDGSFLITWDNDKAKAFANCTLNFRKTPRDGAGATIKSIKLKIENDGEIDPENLDNKAITRPIVLRTVDDEPKRPRRNRTRPSATPDSPSE